MTKKHFIALADALKSECPGANWDPNKKMQWDLDVMAIARVLSQMNPRFNHDLWLSYVRGECGPGGEALRGGK